MTTAKDGTLEARYGKREAARRLRAAKVGVGFFVGAGIPKGERVNTFVECGCCGAYHRTDFEGDCREDSERHWDLPEDATIIETCPECGEQGYSDPAECSFCQDTQRSEQP